jgi:hypothetical protein
MEELTLLQAMQRIIGGTEVQNEQCWERRKDAINRWTKTPFIRTAAARSA